MERSKVKVCVASVETRFTVDPNIAFAVIVSVLEFGPSFRISMGALMIPGVHDMLLLL